MPHTISDQDIEAARKYVRLVCVKCKVWRDQDREEIEGRAMLALVQAAGRYRGDRGASFKTFVSRRLWGSVIDYLRHLKYLSAEICETDLLWHRIPLHHGSREYVTLNGLDRIPERAPRTAYRDSRAGKCRPS